MMVDFFIVFCVLALEERLGEGRDNIDQGSATGRQSCADDAEAVEEQDAESSCWRNECGRGDAW